MPLPFSDTRTRRTAAAAAVLAVSAVAMLAACGDDDGRPAAAVSASTSGSVVTADSTDLGSIIIGWGEQRADDQITTPRPDEITARCHGSGEDLSVDITAPHGWNIHARHGSPTLTLANPDQDLVTADVDTTNRYQGTLHAVDWDQPDQVDITATVDAPPGWNSPDGPRRIYLALHVDCTP